MLALLRRSHDIDQQRYFRALSILVISVSCGDCEGEERFATRDAIRILFFCLLDEESVAFENIICHTLHAGFFSLCDHVSCFLVGDYARVLRIGRFAKRRIGIDLEALPESRIVVAATECKAAVLFYCTDESVRTSCSQGVRCFNAGPHPTAWFDVSQEFGSYPRALVEHDKDVSTFSDKPLLKIRFFGFVSARRARGVGGVFLVVKDFNILLI